MGHNESSAKRKFIALSAQLKKTEKAHIRDLTAHLKALEKKEADSPRRIRRLEIIELRAEINKKQHRKQSKVQRKKKLVLEENQQD